MSSDVRMFRTLIAVICSRVIRAFLPVKHCTTIDILLIACDWRIPVLLGSDERSLLLDK